MSRSPFLLAVLAALALTACTKQAPEFVANDQVPADQRTVEATEGEGGGTEAPAGEVAGTWVVEGTALVFDDAPDTLPAGQVTIALENNSGLVHNVHFEGVANDAAIVEATNATDTGSVELPPGDLTYYCSVPGHREAGMEGTVTVE
jgi:plastocyanin